MASHTTRLPDLPAGRQDVAVGQDRDAVDLVVAGHEKAVHDLCPCRRSRESTVWSKLPVTARRPSAEMEMSLIGPVCAAELMVDSLPVIEVPDMHEPVLSTRQRVAAVAEHCHRVPDVVRTASQACGFARGDSRSQSMTCTILSGRKTQFVAYESDRTNAAHVTAPASKIFLPVSRFQSQTPPCASAPLVPVRANRPSGVIATSRTSEGCKSAGGSPCRI